MRMKPTGIVHSAETGMTNFHTGIIIIEVLLLVDSGGNGSPPPSPRRVHLKKSCKNRRFFSFLLLSYFEHLFWRWWRWWWLGVYLILQEIIRSMQKRDNLAKIAWLDNHTQNFGLYQVLKNKTFSIMSVLKNLDIFISAKMPNIIIKGKDVSAHRNWVGIYKSSFEKKIVLLWMALCNCLGTVRNKVTIGKLCNSNIKNVDFGM